MNHTEQRLPKTFKIPTGLYILVGAVLVILFFTWRHCNSPIKIVDTKPADTAFINIDSINRARDAERSAYRDSMIKKDIELLHMENSIALYRSQLVRDGSTIKSLSSFIRSIPSFTPKEQACDSLIALNTIYMTTVDSLLKASDEKDTIQNAQLQLAIDAVNDADRAYDAVVDQLLVIKGTYDQLKDANKPRVKVMVGLSGTYNPLVFGIGPSLAVQGKKGGVVHGSYQITNGQPLYQVGYLVPIRLRK